MKKKLALSQNIRAARRAANLSQVEAAERAGVSQPTWSVWETGKQLPEVESLRRIAAALGTTVAVLLGER